MKSNFAIFATLMLLFSLASAAGVQIKCSYTSFNGLYDLSSLSATK
jgi:hypothetical protein